VPTFATEAWAGRPIPVWGDGEQTVDLVHTDDVARMLVDALDYGNDATFDGGTGQAVTVNQLAQFVLGVTGSAGGVDYLPMRRGEIPTRIAATGEGWDRLTWRPELDWDAIAEAVLWYRPR
jgi:UDP-glucose 4-epimerase